MVKQRVYLDTTVPSAYFDNRTLDRQRLTKQFWKERLTAFRAVISIIVLLEIRDTPDNEKAGEMERLVGELDILDFTEDAYNLAQEYIRKGIFPEKYTSDANHVAIAVINAVDYLASWNFRHLVNVNIKRQVNLVNALKGFPPIEIVAPPEL